MRALVTGAGGFLGSYLLAELRRRGDEVVAVVRASSRSAEALEAEGTQVLRCDLRRPGEALAEGLSAVDAVYHLAAGTRASWRATFETNVAATENLVDAVTDAGWNGRLVHVSSFSVYALNQLRPGARVDESTPLEPAPGRRDDYAWAKLLQERTVRRLDEADGVEVAVVRPGAIYGRERRFQYRLGRPLGEDIVLMLGGGTSMPLNYVENTASLLAECGRHPRAAGEVFNAVDQPGVTQREYLRRWRHANSGRPRVVPFPLFAFRALGRGLALAKDWTGGAVSPPGALDPYMVEPTLRRFAFAPSRAADVLGWTQPVTTEEALRRTFSTRGGAQPDR